MNYKRFYRRRIYYFAVPVLTIAALFLAVLFIYRVKFDNINETQSTPKQAHSNTAEVNSKENIQESVITQRDINSVSPVHKTVAIATQKDPYTDKLQDEDIKRSTKQLEAMTRACA